MDLTDCPAGPAPITTGSRRFSAPPLATTAPVIGGALNLLMTARDDALRGNKKGDPKVALMNR